MYVIAPQSISTRRLVATGAPVAGSFLNSHGDYSICLGPYTRAEADDVLGRIHPQDRWTVQGVDMVQTANWYRRSGTVFEPDGTTRRV